METTETATTDRDRAGRTDGRTFPLEARDVVRGAVIRMVSSEDGSAPSYSDMTVVDLWPTDGRGNRLLRDPGDVPDSRWIVKLARPYLFATEHTCAPLVGTELLEVSKATLLDRITRPRFVGVVQSTGEIAVMVR